MTLGVALPAFLALSALVEFVIFSRLKSKLPSRMDASYDGEATEQRRRAFNMIIIASALTPVLAYVILHIFAPEIGSIEVF